MARPTYFPYMASSLACKEMVPQCPRYNLKTEFTFCHVTLNNNLH